MPTKTSNEEVYPLEQCETMMRSVAQLMSYGNEDGARTKFETIMKDLKKQGERELISDAIGMRIGNMFDKKFGFHFVDQITDISMDQLLEVPRISYTLIYKIEQALTKRGLRFRDNN